MTGAASDDDHEVFQIGAVLGDPDPRSMEWSDRIGELSRRASALAVGLSTPLWINIVYFVDGTVRTNPFTGVRTGRHFRSRGGLEVQIAISKDADFAALVEQLPLAIDEAEQFAAKRKIATELPAVRRVVDELVRSAQQEDR